MDEETEPVDVAAGPSIHTAPGGSGAYTPIGLGLEPGSVRTGALIMALIPLLIILLFVIQPWTLGSGPAADAQPYDPGSLATGGYTAAATTAPETSASAEGDPTAEASAITTLLTQSHQDRLNVTAAVIDAEACGNPTADAQAFTQAQTDHQTLVNEAGSTAVDAFTDGSELTQDLTTVFQDSATADGDYAQWASDLQQTCTSATATQDSNFQSATTAGQQADTDKATLVAQWNPLAQEYGQQTWQSTDI